MLISQLALPQIILGIVLFLIGLVVYQVKYRGSYSWIILQEWYAKDREERQRALLREKELQEERQKALLREKALFRERSQQITRRYLDAFKRDHRDE